MIDVKVKVTGNRTMTLKVPNDSNIQLVVNESGHGADGWTITMNGKPAALADQVKANCLIILSNRVKGGIQ